LFLFLKRYLIIFVVKWRSPHQPPKLSPTSPELVPPRSQRWSMAIKTAIAVELALPTPESRGDAVSEEEAV
jgi:hypothetical protein